MYVCHIRASDKFLNGLEIISEMQESKACHQDSPYIKGKSMLKQDFILEFVNACSNRTLSTASEKVTLILSAVLRCYMCPDRGGITHIDQVVSRGCIIVPWLEI